MDESHLKSANIIDKQKKDISSLKNEVKQAKQNASKEKLEMLYEETKSYQNFVGFMNEHLLLVRYENGHSNFKNNNKYCKLILFAPSSKFSNPYANQLINYN